MNKKGVTVNKSAFVLATLLLFLFAGCEKSPSGPSGGPSEASILGDWDDADAEEAVTINANHTYEWISYFDTSVVDQRNGNWSLNGNHVTFTETNCGPDCYPADTYTISVNGNVMTLTQTLGGLTATYSMTKQ